MWAGMFSVIGGLALVGVADIVFNSDGIQQDTNGIIAGMVMFSVIGGLA